MTATSSASAAGCCLISNSISDAAAERQAESVSACEAFSERDKDA